MVGPDLGPEVAQGDEGLGARVLDHHPSHRRLVGDEDLVHRHLAEADQHRGLHLVNSDPALALHGDDAGCARILHRDLRPGLDRELPRGEELLAVDPAVDDPAVHEAFAPRVGEGKRLQVAGVLEVGVGVEVPIEEVDDVVEVLVLPLGHVLHQEAPGHAAALDHGLEHGEDVAAPLRLVGQDRARGMEHPGRDQPARSRPQTVGLAEVEHAVVAAVPILQAAAHLGLRGARLQAVVGVGEVVARVVELRREVVALGLALLADLLRLLVVLVHVAGNGAEVVEELGVDRPAPYFDQIALPTMRSPSCCTASRRVKRPPACTT